MEGSEPGQGSSRPDADLRRRGKLCIQQLIRIVCFPRDVFSALLFSVFSVAIPFVPASSITTGAAIATCFAPEENCNAFAVDAVNGAEREILVSAYSLQRVRVSPRLSPARRSAALTSASLPTGPRPAAVMPVLI